MVIRLLHERNLLQTTLTHHLKELNALDNPSGILICAKHGKGYRWRRRYLLNGRIVTVDLFKKERLLAEKLAVNLYRIICIEYLQKLIDSIDYIIRSRHSEARSDVQTKAGLDIQTESGSDIQTKSGSDVQTKSGLDMRAESGLDMRAEESIDAQIELARGDILAGYLAHELLCRIRNCPRVPADFFHSRSPYRPLITSHLEREYAWIINWYLSDFPQSQEYPDALQYPTKLGFNVRSKSEMLAANRLLEAGILFHYEELVLPPHEESYPDFYMPVTVVERYIWEHCGAMDKEKYCLRTKGKISTYLNYNWLPGMNLILTSETRQHPLTEEEIDHQITWLKERYRIAFPDLPPDDSFNMYDLAAAAKYRRSKQ